MCLISVSRSAAALTPNSDVFINSIHFAAALLSPASPVLVAAAYPTQLLRARKITSQSCWILHPPHRGYTALDIAQSYLDIVRVGRAYSWSTSLPVPLPFLKPHRIQYVYGQLFSTDTHLRTWAIRRRSLSEPHPRITRFRYGHCRCILSPEDTIYPSNQTRT